MLDDLGWHDVGWHNAELKLPNLDALRASGIGLDRAYAYRFCSPSRSSLLSGRLPYHVNQYNNGGEALGGGVHTNFTVIAAKLKLAGYATHQLGKWHAGQSSADLTPRGRGFDTSLGYLNGAEDHWTQWRSACGDPHFVDLFATDRPAVGRNGSYGAQIYHDEALALVEAHDATTPFFLYMAFQINHEPLQVPERYARIYPCAHAAECGKRSTYQAMTAMADEVMGNLTAALKGAQMWETTLLVLSSDNGGPSGSDADSANNYPLRGGKYSDFEGGVRVAAFVSGGAVPAARRGLVLEGATAYVHLVDFYATFCGLAGVDAKDDDAVDAAGRALPPVDSLDLWPFLVGDTVSPRTEIPLTLGRHQPGGSAGALIVGQYKLLLGVQLPAIWNGPEYPNGTKPTPHSVDCGDGCLFDIIADPSEYHDLARTLPDVLANLTARFAMLSATSYQTPFITGAINCTAPRVIKMRATGFWAPWTDDHCPPDALDWWYK